MDKKNNPGVSQEIVNHWLRVPALLCLLLIAMNVILWSSIKDIEEALHVIAHLEHTSQITAAVAIIRSTPNCAQSIIKEDLVPFITKLMGPQDM